MPLTHQVAGVTEVKWNNIQLGFSRDGVTIRTQPYYEDIHSDDFGGASAPPADSQFMGAIALVTAELTKWNEVEVNKLGKFGGAGSRGTVAVIGSLVRAGGLFGSLFLDNAGDPRTYARAFLRQAQEVNVGTKYSTFIVGWECWIDTTGSRILFS